MSEGYVEQKPFYQRAESIGELLACVTHPAFRIGFLDAQFDRGFDHDKIGERILAETPEGALRRLGYSENLFDKRKKIEVAQYRYEEGRQAFFEKGLRCKAWGHPDYPPAQVMNYIRRRSIGEID